MKVITPPINRAKLEPFDKTNAGNLHKYRLSAFLSVIQTPLCQVVMWCFSLILVVKIREFCLISTCCVNFRENVLSFCCHNRGHSFPQDHSRFYFSEFSLMYVFALSRIYVFQYSSTV